MKLLRILLALALLCTMIPFAAVTAASPTMSISKTVYDPSQTITVSYSGTNTNDWIGIYPYGVYPGGYDPIVREYAVGSGTVTFKVSSLSGAGDYRLFLCDNNGYKVLDSIAFTVRDGESTDYGVKSATVQASIKNGRSDIDVTVTPSSSASLTYRFYWANNGVRLTDYLPIKELTHSGSETFTVSLNDCLFMPDSANSIEVAVVNGTSSSYFVAAPDKLKVPSAKLLYEFQVLSDLHISLEHKAHIPNFKAAMQDILKNSPNSNGIVFVGDSVDKGTQEHYELLLKTIAETGAKMPMYFGLGNHELVYGGTYEEVVARFLENLKMPGQYYTFDIGGSRFIMMSPEEQSTLGAVSEAQLNWLESQMALTDPDMPVFVFLHQQLKDTVSGSVSSLGQTGGGVPNQAARIRSILKNYPNAIYFSGHTHRALEMLQPFLYGEGVDASFMNTASTAYLRSDAKEDLKGSQGLFVEVYEDYILIKGREFTQSKWSAATQIKIPRKVNAGEGELVSNVASDWAYDNTVMQVATTDYATTFYNTDGTWPYADYIYDAPITVDPDCTTLYIDMMMDTNACANIYLYAGRSMASLAAYIPKMSYDASSGDLIGNGKRVRTTVDLSQIAFDPACYNEDGTLTIKRTRVYASGEAYAKTTIYDFSLVNASSDKTVSLMNSDTLTVDTAEKTGGYTYDNGTLTVTSTDSGKYSVSFVLDETYDVSFLKNWVFDVNATVPFDITITASTSKDDITFGLARDFWPSLCEAKVNGYLPSGTYQTSVDLYSCYTFNDLVPSGSKSMIKRVTITLSEAGSITVNGLQISSGNTVQTLKDGMYATAVTPLVQIGDVNGDNTVSTVDARMILSCVVGVATDFTDAQMQAADFDKDGTISTTDVRKLLQDVVSKS